MYSIVLMPQNKKSNFNQIPKRNGNYGGSWVVSSDIDVLFALAALIILTPSFWSIIALAIGMDLQNFQNSLVLNIAKSIICSIGFIFVAVKWELAAHAATRFFVPIVLIGLTFLSTIWSLSPSETLRGSIQFFLIWVLGLGFTLRFKPSDFASFCGVAGATAIAFQIFIQIFAKDGASIGFMNAELGLAIVAFSWAMKTSNKYKLIWGAFALFGAIIAIYSKDEASFGGAIGVLMALAIETILKFNRSHMLQMAWVFVVILLGATIFLITRGQIASFAISELLDNLGSRSLFGIGFGTNDGTIFNEIAQGLGLFGLGVSVCLLMVGIYYAIFPINANANSLLPAFGLTGLIIATPNQIYFDSSLVIILCAVFYSSFCSEIKQPKRKSIRKR
ncbi:MAG: hypothetical protein FD163_1839 [Hyphomonadaceae bacterium]|nr:MAG: hypothetical protein FD128_1128 [Hyphomonadaceae bacterium]KAF0184265.1 MAG: hypothetical protein FD163_1839 [Hyphomonadaceae bacterium]